MCDLPVRWRPPVGAGSAQQAGHPKGLVGRLFGAVVAHRNYEMNLFTLERLDVRPGHRVLEIGFGPGRLIAASPNTHGKAGSEERTTLTR